MVSVVGVGISCARARRKRSDGVHARYLRAHLGHPDAELTRLFEDHQKGVLVEGSHVEADGNVGAA